MIDRLIGAVEIVLHPTGAELHPHLAGGVAISLGWRGQIGVASDLTFIGDKANQAVQRVARGRGHVADQIFIAAIARTDRPELVIAGGEIEHRFGIGFRRRRRFSPEEIAEETRKNCRECIYDGGSERSDHWIARIRSYVCESSFGKCRCNNSRRYGRKGVLSLNDFI